MIEDEPECEGIVSIDKGSELLIAPQLIQGHAGKRGDVGVEPGRISLEADVVNPAAGRYILMHQVIQSGVVNLRAASLVLIRLMQGYCRRAEQVLQACALGARNDGHTRYE